MVSKSDITSNKPATSDLIQVSSGELVLAETENSNNLLNLNAIILAYNWIIDSAVELTATNVFTAAQTFNAGLKTGQIDPLTTNGNVILNIGTGKAYINSAASGNELQTLTQINTLINTLVGTSFDLTNGGIKTTDFSAASGSYYFVSGASGDVQATLPASPTDGDIIGFVNYLQNFASNTNQFEIASASHNVQGGTATSGSPEVLINFYALYLIYDTTTGWYRL